MESALNVPLIAVPELPNRWLVTEDTIEGHPVAHLLISFPNATVRVSWDKATVHEVCEKLLAAVDGPRIETPPSGLTVVENRVSPNHPANGGKRP